MRPSTENTPLIVGLARAFELAVADQEKENRRLSQIQSYAINKISKEIPNAVLNGPTGDKRVVNNVNIAFPNIEGEYATVTLSENGIAVGTRSACIGEAGGPSYVLEAMGKSELAKNSLRFSFGKTTKKKHIDKLVSALMSMSAHFKGK